MNIADTLCKKILADITWQTRPSLDAITVGDYSDDNCLSEDMFNDAHDLDIYQEREPDSAPEHPDQPASISVLGTYHWMASPGIITLYRTNIETYWHCLLRHTQRQFPFIYREDAERVLHLIVHSVYQHEQFHYICDFSRRLFGSSYDRLHEESLAVALEWHWLKTLGGNTFFGRLHPTIRHLIVRQMFHHTSRGYRDWRNHIVQADFNNAVRDYLCPQSSLLFANSDLDFGRWLVSHVPDVGNKAWIEQLGI